MKKVLHFIITDVFSGAESVAAHIIKNLPQDWCGWYASPAGKGIEAAKEMGLQTLICDTSDTRDIRRVYNEIKPDAVHAHDPRMSFNCARAGIPFVAHLHNNCLWLRKLCPNSVALLYVCKRAEKVFCVSQSIIDEYIFSGALKKKAEVLHNCLDRDEIEEKAAEALDKSYDVSFVGRLTRQKQPFEFVRLVAMLKEKKPDISAVMVGDGELREEVNALAKQLGVDGCIETVGYQSNPYKYMAASKIGVLTSAWEGFGLVAVEHLLLGKPFVCYPVGGLVNIVNDENGKLCRDATDMASQILRLLSDGAYYQSKSRAAVSSAGRFCDRKTYTEKIIKAYSDGVDY